MYLALYRKYRPRTFLDVAGQEPIVQTLRNQIKENRHFHAYLFTGSRGTGKTTCAKILAKAVNCLNPKDGDPCNECEACKAIDDGSVTDIVEIDAASNNGVDSIRQLRDEANFTPVYAKYRVYIIDEVHMLSSGAFNALLKTLEEPPEHVKFILATTEIQKLPNTIISRCQRFDFKRISISDISKRLKYVAQNENATIDDDATEFIASLADGSMRDSLSILDQCISKDKNVTLDTIHDVIGLADKTKLYNVVSSVIKGDKSTALKTVSELYVSLSDMERFCDSLIWIFRNIMIVKAVDDCKDLLNAEQNETEFCKSCAEMCSLNDIIRALDVVEKSRINLKDGVNRLIETEIAVIKLCNIFNGDLQENKKEIEIPKVKEKATKENPVDNQIKEKVKEKTPVEKIPNKEKVEYKKEEAKPEEKSVDKKDLKADLINLIYKKDRIFSGTLDNAIIDESDNKISINTQNLLFNRMVKEKIHSDKIKEAVVEIYGDEYKFEVGAEEKAEIKSGESEKNFDDLIDTINKAGFNL